MKKFIVVCSLILALATTILFIPACKTQVGLIDNVSQLKLNLYEGESSSYRLRAFYGFDESPDARDSKVGNKVYKLTFKLIGKETESVKRSLSFTHRDKKYTADFMFNPVKNSVMTTVEIEDFFENEFEVEIISSNEREKITLSSTLPENSLSFEKALEFLEKNQPSLINSYKDENGVFQGEIHLRVIVKDQKPYWYVGLLSTDKNLKALLIDGFTGDILAIREVL